MKKRRVGRPRAEGETRSRHINVPVLPSEYERYAQAAKAKECTLAEWVRAQLKIAVSEPEESSSPGGDDDGADRDRYIMSTRGKTPTKTDDPAARRQRRSAA